MTEIPLYDKLGYCVLCHNGIGKEKKFISEDGKDNFSAMVWGPDRRRIELKLHDGSRLVVEICHDCNEQLEEKDYPKIMYSAYRGQEEEVRKTTWEPEKKKQYLEGFQSLKIIGRA